MAIDKCFDADEYWDLLHLGLIDRKGNRVPNQEQHEFMIGYYEDNQSKRKSQDYLDSVLIASLAAACALTAVNC